MANRVSFEITPQVEAYLTTLRKTGLYGHTLGNVARRIVEQRLAELLLTAHSVIADEAASGG